MSFAQAHLPTARFIPNWVNGERSYKLAEGVIEASRRNNKITIRDMGGEAGKLRDFKASYYPVNCAPVADNCNTSICDGGTAMTLKQQFFTLSKCTASKNYTLAVDDIRMVDGMFTFSDHAKAQLRTIMPQLRRDLAVDMGADIYANTGLMPDGSPSRRVQFVNTTTGAANLSATNTINRIFQDTGFTEPFILGGTEIFDLSEAIRIGGLNALGQRIDALDYTNKYYDALVNEVVGDGGEHVIAFDPQVLKFVSWSYNAGMFATDLKSIDNLDMLFKQGPDGSIYGSFLDPVLGILWDLDVVYDKCTKTFTMKVFLKWDIFYMPDINCNEFGVNGIFHFTTCAPVLTPCPVGDAIPAAPAAATFEFDTSGDYSFPFTIYDLSIAGRVTQPNITVTNMATLAAAFNDGGNIAFTVDGTKLEYTAYAGETGITVRVNGQEDTFTEAA